MHDHCFIPIVQTTACVDLSHQSSVQFAPIPSSISFFVYTISASGVGQPLVSSGIMAGVSQDLIMVSHSKLMFSNTKLQFHVIISLQLLISLKQSKRLSESDIVHTGQQSQWKYEPLSY